MTIREVTSPGDREIAELASILVAVVAEGASVGFLPPLEMDAAKEYWRTGLGPGTILLVAEQEARIVGTAQLALAMRPNGQHRAEVKKVLVHPAVQRQGIGRALMEAIEVIARQQGRTLLHLDTREGDPSNQLYQSLGYIEAGRIPCWARSADGRLHTTVFYFKLLGTDDAPLDGLPAPPRG
ncbi:MAG: GNAT family N-acetyltransferase [Chloroflexota bacterium]